VRRILITEFGAETLPHTIDTERVESFRERMLADGQLSRRPIQKILVLLHGILKRAKRKGWIVANPAVARADGSEYVHHVPQTDAASRLSALLERGEAASASSLRRRSGSVRAVIVPNVPSPWPVGVVAAPATAQPG
jgi:hypothetical protein